MSRVVQSSLNFRPLPVAVSPRDNIQNVLTQACWLLGSVQPTGPTTQSPNLAAGCITTIHIQVKIRGLSINLGRPASTPLIPLGRFLVRNFDCRGTGTPGVLGPLPSTVSVLAHRATGSRAVTAPGLCHWCEPPRVCMSLIAPTSLGRHLWGNPGPGCPAAVQ